MNYDELVNKLMAFTNGFIFRDKELAGSIIRTNVKNYIIFGRPIPIDDFISITFKIIQEEIIYKPKYKYYETTRHKSFVIDKGTKIENIPLGVTELFFCCNKPVDGYIPDSVTKLFFGGDFDGFFNQDVKDNLLLLVNLTHLDFGMHFNQDIKGKIPATVTHLKFGGNFNQIIKDCIPNSVTHLVFGSDFNQDIEDCIPNSVTHLIFGSDFNQDIKGKIPNTITHLTLGCGFNRYGKGCIPESITHLTLGYGFNKCMDEIDLPTSVTELRVPDTYGNEITVPDTCKIIKLAMYKYHEYW